MEGTRIAGHGGYSRRASDSETPSAWVESVDTLEAVVDDMLEQYGKLGDRYVRTLRWLELSVLVNFLLGFALLCLL